MKIYSVALATLFVAAPANAFLPASVSDGSCRTCLFGTRKNLADAWTGAVQRGQNPAQVTVDAAKFSVNRSMKTMLEKYHHDDVTEDSIESAFAEFEALGGGDVLLDDSKSWLEEAIADAEVAFYEDMALASQEIEKDKFILSVADAEDKFHKSIRAAERRYDAPDFYPGSIQSKSAVVLEKVQEFMEDPAVQEKVEKVSKVVEQINLKEEAPKIAVKVGGVLSVAAGMFVKRVVEPTLEQVGTSLKQAKIARQLQGTDGEVTQGRIGKSMEEILKNAEEDEKILADHMENVQQVLMEAERMTEEDTRYENYFD